MTKDERFLIELYRAAKEEGTADPNKIGELLGYREKLIKNILKGLMQANLVKRFSPEEIGLTERGVEVVRALLQ